MPPPQLIMVISASQLGDFTNASLHYCNFSLPITIKSHILDVYKHTLMGPFYVFDHHFPNGHQEHISLCMLGHNHHLVFQYVQLWDAFQQLTTILGNHPLPHKILINWWSQLICQVHCHPSTIWDTIVCHNSDLPFDNLVKIFFSLIHCFGTNIEAPLTYIPNQIGTGNCLAHYLCHDLRLI